MAWREGLPDPARGVVDASRDAIEATRLMQHLFEHDSFSGHAEQQR
jgi:hypothetical protein